MRFLLALLGLACPLLAATSGTESWTLERLFTRPFMWGTPPSEVTWSKQGHTLLFLWNAEGRPFRDLYSYNPDERKLFRLTDLAGVHDEMNLTEAEKDEWRKQYLLPQAGIESFDLARDGSRAAFSYQGDLYIVRTDGREPPFRLTKTKTPEKSPQLSPDGKKIAFDRGGQLFVQNLQNGQLLQLTDGAEIRDFRWSPDGRRFVYLTAAKSPRELLLPNYSGRLVTTRRLTRTLAGDEPSQSQIFIVSAEGGKPVEIEPRPAGASVWSFSTPEWSPDSSLLLHRVIHPDMKREELLVFDAVTGKARTLFEETDPAWANEMTAGWSPDGHFVFFTSERDGWSHLYKVLTAGGKPVQLTRGKWEIHPEHLIYPQDPQWVGEYLYYTSTEAGPSERQFYRIHADGTGETKLSAGEGVNVGIASEDGEHFAIMQSDLHRPMELYVDGRPVTPSSQPAFGEYPWPETRFVTFLSRGDGKPVAGKMLLPPGFRAKGKVKREKLWPAIFFIHGAGYATSVLKQWGSYQELRYVYNCYLANRGYVVFDLDYRGSSGYGRDWRTDVYLNMGGPDLDDVLGAVDYAGRMGNIDMKRLGIWGVSYGGFMTDMAMFRAPDVFRAGAAFSAVNDWQNYNAFYTEQRLNKPRENPEAYRRSSPIYFSSMLKNPLLIVHGMADDNVMFQDAVQLSEKLIHEGKDFEQIYYPEESHSFTRDETLIDVFRRTTEFFDKYLRR